MLIPKIILQRDRNLVLISLIALFLVNTGESFAQDVTPPAVLSQIANQTINEDQNYRFALKLDEVFSDENAMTFAVDLNDADWLTSVDDSLLVGFPLEEHIGQYNIMVIATDVAGNSTSTSFFLTVTEVDDKPIVVKGLPGLLQRPGFGALTVYYKDVFFDEEDKDLTYEVNSSYSAVATAQLLGDSILVTERGVGPVEIILTATDSHGNSTETKMFLRIYEDAEVLNMTTGNTGSNGLSNSKISCVKIDNSGNIWATARGEINKYNNGAWEQYVFPNTGIISDIWDDMNGSVYFFAGFVIIKYDGSDFVRISGNKEPLPRNIVSTYTKNDSVLYVAGYNRGSDKYFKIIKSTDNGWEDLFYEKRDTLYTTFDISHMCVDSEEKIWLVTNRGLEKIVDSERIVINSTYDVSKPVEAMTIDIYGNIWFNTLQNLYEYNPVERALKEHSLYDPICVYADDIGNVWVGQRNKVTKVFNGAVTVYNLKDPISRNLMLFEQNAVGEIFKTKDGRIWFCSEYGLYVAENYLIKDESTIVQNTFDGLSSNDVLDIQRDTEGVYYVYTSSGFSKYNGENWEFIGGNVKFHCVDKESGKIYVSDNIGTFFILDKNDKIEFPWYVTQTGLIHDVDIDKDGNVWLASSKGLKKFDGKTWTHYSSEDGLPTDIIECLFVDSKSNIWCGHFDAWQPKRLVISKFDRTSFSSYFFLPEGTGQRPKTFLEDLEGSIWMGGQVRGLMKYDGKDWSIYTKEDGLKDNTIMSLSLDYLGGVWITYEADGMSGKGVSRFDGTKFDHFTTENGLPTNRIKKVYVDHALTNQNKSGLRSSDETTDLIWLSTEGKGAANFYLQNATSVVDYDLPEMKALIFPNPTQGITNIILDCNNRKYVDVEILNMDGKLIYQDRTEDISGNIQLNLSSNPPGVYLVKLKSNIDSVVKKIILK